MAAAAAKAKAKGKGKGKGGVPAALPPIADPFVPPVLTPEQVAALNAIDNANRLLVLAGEGQLMEHSLQTYRRNSLDTRHDIAHYGTRWIRTWDMVRYLTWANSQPVGRVGQWGTLPTLTRVWVPTALVQRAQSDLDGFHQLVNAPEEAAADDSDSD